MNVTTIPSTDLEAGNLSQGAQQFGFPLSLTFWLCRCCQSLVTAFETNALPTATTICPTVFLSPVNVSEKNDWQKPTGSITDNIFDPICVQYVLVVVQYSVQCTVYSVQCTAYSVQCTEYVLVCTVYSACRRRLVSPISDLISDLVWSCCEVTLCKTFINNSVITNKRSITRCSIPGSTHVNSQISPRTEICRPRAITEETVQNEGFFRTDSHYCHLFECIFLQQWQILTYIYGSETLKSYNSYASINS